GLPVGEGGVYLPRPHPLVEGLAAYVLDTALDPAREGGVARRSGAIRTGAVATRTTLLLCRFRFDITTVRTSAEQTQLAEETRLLAFEGPPSDEATWLAPERAETLLDARPASNIGDDQKQRLVAGVVAGYAISPRGIEGEARARPANLLDAHRRVRSAAREPGPSYRGREQLQVAVLGPYAFLPGAP